MGRDRVWDILSVGDSSMDLFIRVPRLPGRDEKLLGHLLARSPGGVAANFACAAARFGARTAFAGVVGDDAYGLEAIASLQHHGVNASALHQRPGGESFWCLVMLDDSGEKALTVIETNCMSPRRAEIDPELFSQTRLVHVSANDPELAAWVAVQARSRGALVSVDLEPPGLRDPVSLKTVLAHCDLVFPNRQGLTELKPGEPDLAAMDLLNRGASLVVVTMGSDGALIVNNQTKIKVPACAVKAVDTTGAGDCFNGSFVGAYLQGYPLAECGRLAAAAAALSVTAIGARGRVPSLSEAQTFANQT